MPQPGSRGGLTAEAGLGPRLGAFGALAITPCQFSKPAESRTSFWALGISQALTPRIAH